MRQVNVSDPLLERVLEQANQERRVAREAGSRRSPKRPSRLKLAAAACLAAALMVTGLTLAWPSLSPLGGADASSSFTLKAYGGIDDALLPDGSQGMIAFNCETETQRFVSPNPDEYANEGFYTGCVFRVEGEGIARIQANVSRGELYRVTSEEFTAQSNPALAQEVDSWKPTKRGQGELLGAYDHVAGVLFHEAVNPDDENADKLRGDPSMARKVNLYQRLGATVDTDANAGTATDATLDEYAFGLWTNEPFDAVDPSDPAVDPDANLDAALDTLDGAQLTVTVTFHDGRCETQVIDLHAADFKANLVTVANGMNKMLELVPQIVAESDEEYRALAASGEGDAALIHTLYGLVAEENDGAFPCGEASHPELVEPLTKPQVIEAPPQPVDAGDIDTTRGPDLPKDAVGELGTPFPGVGNVLDADGNRLDRADVVRTYERIERLDALPEGAAITDMLRYYEAGGRYDPTLDHIDNERGGYSIAADGTLTDGFSYVLLTQTVVNESDQAAEAYLGSGYFATLEAKADDGDAYLTRLATAGDKMLWRSGHEEPGWDTHFLFQVMQPGETREFAMLFVVPDEALADPDLAFVYYDDEAGREKAVRVGAVA